MKKISNAKAPPRPVANHPMNTQAAFGAHPSIPTVAPPDHVPGGVAPPSAMPMTPAAGQMPMGGQ